MATLQINGKTQTFDASPDRPLLWALRDILGLTGTKFGCGIAQCGCGPHLFDRESRCPRKTDVASLIRDCGTPNRSAAVDRSDCADRFRLSAAAGYRRRGLC